MISRRRCWAEVVAGSGLALLTLMLYRAGAGPKTASPCMLPTPSFAAVPEEVAPPLAHLSNLIMVAGHAVFTAPSFTPEAARKEISWQLEPYQQVPGQAASFVEMIEDGVALASEDPTALLLFSGGETRRDAGPLSEGGSYWRVAEAAGWYGHPGVRGRAATESFARDSFENLLFSICRFKELTGRYPASITVSSYGFKEHRFRDLHRAALRWPSARFQFSDTASIGGDHEESPQHLEGRLKGEAGVVALFTADPYGCGDTLGTKKRTRNPFAKAIPYLAQCPELSELFLYCSAEEGALFAGPLPWDSPI